MCDFLCKVFEGLRDLVARVRTIQQEDDYGPSEIQSFSDHSVNVFSKEALYMAGTVNTARSHVARMEIRFLIPTAKDIIYVRKQQEMPNGRWF